MREKLRDNEQIKSSPEKSLSAAEFDRPHKENKEVFPSSNNNDLESARKSVEQESLTNESEKVERPINEDPKIRITALDKERSYISTMSRVQSQLPTLSKRFSKLVHSKPVEKASGMLEATLARPSGILGGSLFALFGMSIMLFYAKRNGFTLSGSELILLFIIGWVVGILFEIIWKKIIKRL